MRRLIAPWEYRHARFFGTGRLLGATAAAAAGGACLAYDAFGWAAFFLVIGALNFAGGCWLISIAREESRRSASASAAPR
jgi:hypothetical protein